MARPVPRFRSASLSDQGPVRGNNEDRVYADDERGLYAVVDGMGGHEAGEHAAEIAVERLRARLERQTGTAEQRMREAIALANNAIYEAAEDRPEWRGMACVLTAAAIEDGHVIVGHVGDSRLYRIRHGSIEKITHDHSPVGEREDAGELSEAEAMHHPRRNEVFRDVGSQPRTPDDEDFIELIRIPFEPDAALLLCSDGLSDALPSARILETVEKNAGHRESAARELIQAATENGRDNISLVLVEGRDFAKTSSGRRAPVGPLIAALFLGVLVGVLTAGTAAWFWLRAHRPPAVHVPRTIVVSPPQTLASALGSAVAMDTVSLPAGRYPGDIRLKNGVTLKADPPREAVIAGRIHAADVSAARLEDLVVEEPVRIAESDVALIGSTLNGGVEVSGNSRGSIVACSIRNPNGPAISLTGSASPRLDHNVIEYGAAPGLVVKSSLRPSAAGNIFTGPGNTPPVWLSVADPAIVDRNYFPGFGPKDRRPKVKILSPETLP